MTLSDAIFASLCLIFIAAAAWCVLFAKGGTEYEWGDDESNRKQKQ